MILRISLMKGSAKIDITIHEEETWLWFACWIFDAIDHARTKGRCRLVLSDTHKGDSPRQLYIYKRWISCIYTINGDAARSFILKKMDSLDVTSGKRMVRYAKYSIALQYLVLEGIVVDVYDS